MKRLLLLLAIFLAACTKSPTSSTINSGNSAKAPPIVTAAITAETPSSNAPNVTPVLGTNQYPPVLSIASEFSFNAGETAYLPLQVFDKDTATVTIYFGLISAPSGSDMQVKLQPENRRFQLNATVSGDYVLSVRAEDADGHLDTQSIQIAVVGSVPTNVPTPSITPIPGTDQYPPSLNVQSTISFDAGTTAVLPITITDYDSPILDIFWQATKWPEGGDLAAEFNQNTGAFSLSSTFGGEYTFVIRAVDPDGHSDEKTVTINVIAIVEPNEPPTFESVQFNLQEATVLDTLALSVNGMSDPEGEAVFVSQVVWQVNGAVTDKEDWKKELPLSFFSKHDVISAYAVITDGEHSVNTDTVSITIANMAPELGVLNLSVDIPNTTDTVTASQAVLNDQDGDTPVSSYQWVIDGQVVSETDTLAANVAQKGDKVTVIATTTDGDAVLTKERSFTVVDALPEISTTNLPEKIQFGEQLYATFTIVDPDLADPQPELAIAFGPAGMQLEGQSNALTWVVDPVMFASTETIRFGLKDVLSGKTKAYQIEVLDSQRKAITVLTDENSSSWIADSGSSFTGFSSAGFIPVKTGQFAAVFYNPEVGIGNEPTALMISDEGEISSRRLGYDNRAYQQQAIATDFNKDGAGEVVYRSSRSWEGVRLDVLQLSNNSSLFSTKNGNDSYQSIAMGDANGDDYQDLVAASNSHIELIDVVNRNVLWRSADGIFDYISAVKILNDGRLAVLTTRGSFVLQKSGDQYAQVLQLRNSCTQVEPLTLRDGRNVIACLAASNSAGISREGTVVLLDPTQNKELGRIEIGYEVFDLSADLSGHNLYVMYHMGSYSHGKTQISLVDLLAGTNVWSSPQMPGRASENVLKPFVHQGIPRLQFNTDSALYFSH